MQTQMFMTAEPLNWVLREKMMGPQLRSWEGGTGVKGVPTGNQSRAWNLGL